MKTKTHCKLYIDPIASDTHGFYFVVRIKTFKKTFLGWASSLFIAPNYVGVFKNYDDIIAFAEKLRGDNECKPPQSA